MTHQNEPAERGVREFRDATAEIDRLKESIAGLNGVRLSLAELTAVLGAASTAASESANALAESAAQMGSATAELARFNPDRILSEMIRVRERVVAEADRARDELETRASDLNDSIAANRDAIAVVRKLVLSGFIALAALVSALAIVAIVIRG